MMVNIANPAAAFQWWRLPAKGVGLARMEFIINAHIKVHPMALVHPERTSPEAQRQIRELTRGYAHPSDYFIDVLARDRKSTPSELQSLMRISYAVFCLKKKTTTPQIQHTI